MKLRALDQVHISSVQADSLRPGQEFEVSDDLGAKMLKSLPGHLEKVGEPFGGKGDHDDNGATGGAAAPAGTPAPISALKAEPAPQNKAEPAAPANKATARRKTKGK
jgi:hypothetical protein